MDKETPTGINVDVGNRKVVFMTKQNSYLLSVFDQVKDGMFTINRHADKSINAELSEICNDMYKLIEKLERHLVVKGK